MSAVVSGQIDHESPHGLRVSIAQILLLAQRSVIGTFRQPASFMPALVFPLFISAVNSSTMGRAVDIPAFPQVDSMLDFLLAGAVTHGVLFGGITSGADTAVDIENGFWDRLLSSPVGRSNLLVGRLAGAAVFGAAQATVFTVIFVLFGVSIKGGIGGFVVLVLFAVLLALFVGGLAAMLALRTGSAEAVQNFFPLTFILMFVSSAFFPTQLMGGVYRTIAESNPITWMIDGVRHQIITGFDPGEAATSLVVALALATISILGANAALRSRVKAS